MAVTSVKIDGILHEFSTIEGVKEDVTEIILNIKGLIVKINGDGPKVVYIEAEGPGEVKAGSIKCDSEVEILEPEMHIATLGEGAKLYMEITLDKGRGYVPAERNKQQMTPVIGVIPVDSIYTPVLKVNYTVENTRVGQITDYDKLTLEVWTNGTISAKEAVSLGAKVQVEYTRRPPGARSSAAASRIPACRRAHISTSSGLQSSRAAASFRNIPSPEQGASTNTRTLWVILVAYQQALPSHLGRQLGGLAAGSGAQIQDPQARLHPQQLRRGHGAGLLQVVQPRLMPGVQAGPLL